MGESYKVTDSFYVNGRTVLGFDCVIFDELDKEHIIVGGKYMSYLPTTNEYWISVEGNGDYSGQTVEFVK